MTNNILIGQRQAEVSVLSSQLIQALSIIQGVALTHQSTKAFLGRKYPLDVRNVMPWSFHILTFNSKQVLLDLLITSRHLASPLFGSKQPTPSEEACTQSDDARMPSALPNAVLDTLLCVLVDSSRSLRAFEDCNGVQTVVKLLKRSQTPREVRCGPFSFCAFLS